MPDTCTGYADSFKMPPHFQGESLLALNFAAPPFLALLDNYKTLSDKEQEMLHYFEERFNV